VTVSFEPYGIELAFLDILKYISCCSCIASVFDGYIVQFGHRSNENENEKAFKSKDDVRKELNSIYPHDENLMRAKEVFSPEFEGDFPVAKINFQQYTNTAHRSAFTATLPPSSTAFSTSSLLLAPA